MKWLEKRIQLQKGIGHIVLEQGAVCRKERELTVLVIVAKTKCITKRRPLRKCQLPQKPGCFMRCSICRDSNQVYFRLFNDVYKKDNEFSNCKQDNKAF